jgi:long-chain acyl-CoA synthetase
MTSPVPPRSPMLERLRRSAELTPADVVVRMDAGTELTYGTLYQRARSLAGGLARDGLPPGGVVAVVARERDWPDFLVACYGVYLAGGCVLPLSARLPLAAAQGILRAVPGLSRTVDCAPPGCGTGLGTPMAHIETGAEPLASPVLRFPAGQPACVIPTAGTTGSSMLVLCPWENVDANHGGDSRAPGQPRARLMISPVIGTMVAQTLVHDSCSGPLFLIAPEFDADRFVAMIERDRPTNLTLVPATASILCGRLRQAPADVSSVRVVVCGSAYLSARVFTELGDLFPHASVYNSYGLTEGGSIVNPLAAGRPNSLGRPDPDTEVRILGPDGQDVPAGVTGDLLIREPGLPSRRTLGDSSRAGRAGISADGWIYTGDRVHADPDGYLYLVGRSSEIVDVGGRKIPLPQVEDCLTEHPAVEMAAVVALPHELTGSILVGVAQLSRPVPAAELLRHCAARLPASHRPQRIIIDRVPLTLAGKLDRPAVLGLVQSAVAGPAGDKEEPQDDLLATVVGVWEDVLQLQPVSPADRIRDFGAHSLLCAAVTLKLRELLGWQVPVSMVLIAETPAALAAGLRTATADGELPGLQLIPRRYDI